MGSYSASVDVKTDKSDLTILRFNLCYTVKGLVKNQVPITEFFQESIYGVRFNELSRIKELVSQIKSQRESSVVSNGHALAMASAASGLSASAHLNQRWSGLTAVSHIKELDKLINDPIQEVIKHYDCNNSRTKNKNNGRVQEQQNYASMHKNHKKVYN